VTGRAVEEYIAVLGDATFGAATDVVPKFVSPADPAARWTGARGGQAFFAYCTNYLIDVDNGVIVDVEAPTAIREAEVLAAKRMMERSAQFCTMLLATLRTAGPVIRRPSRLVELSRQVQPHSARLR
jgi:hypothetical protein